MTHKRRHEFNINTKNRNRSNSIEDADCDVKIDHNNPGQHLNDSQKRGQKLSPRSSRNTLKFDRMQGIQETMTTIPTIPTMTNTDQKTSIVLILKTRIPACTMATATAIVTTPLCQALKQQISIPIQCPSRPSMLSPPRSQQR